MLACKILFLEEQQVDFAFFHQFAFGWFFGAELKSFAGCVNKRQQTSIRVNKGLMKRWMEKTFRSL
ncbi:MAG TPA: hypothetical protein VK536_00285, partial [Candidatus Limnocylindrales bacterium]|nr:hypothetical protein [Candidatus Limnocylindrales bacterium]